MATTVPRRLVGRAAWSPPPRRRRRAMMGRVAAGREAVHDGGWASGAGRLCTGGVIVVVGVVVVGVVVVVVVAERVLVGIGHHDAVEKRNLCLPWAAVSVQHFPPGSTASTFACSRAQEDKRMEKRGDPGSTNKVGQRPGYFANEGVGLVATQGFGANVRRQCKVAQLEQANVRVRGWIALLRRRPTPSVAALCPVRLGWCIWLFSPSASSSAHSRCSVPQRQPRPPRPRPRGPTRGKTSGAGAARRGHGASGPRAGRCFDGAVPRPPAPGATDRHLPWPSRHGR